MSYSAHAYRDFSRMLGAVHDEINDEARSRMTDEEKRKVIHTFTVITEKVTEIFEADNPRGFDKCRFFDDVYGEDRP